jgi:hypothetical protein
MADFIQAMKWMEDGEKVRRERWSNKKYYWWVDINFTFDNLWCIKDSDDGDACMIRSYIEADDWELFALSENGKLGEPVA